MMRSVLVLSACVMVSACSAKPELVDELAQSGCHYFGAPQAVAPDWICSAKVKDVTSLYTVVGVSENAAGGVSHQRNLAILDGQQLIGKQLESDVVQVMQKKLATLGVEGSNGGTGATSEETMMRTNVMLKGLDVLRVQKGPDGFMYVLVSMSEKSLEQNVENLLDTDNNAELAGEISAVLSAN
ncbi:hypothetical protein [Enterovibrio calviensis]|uniref:hypothetical protein n=1 Tax=Enterovibrio calviensis TaxID=91359 RepID=UPI0037352C11